MNKFISYGFVSSIALLPGLLFGSQSAQAQFATGSLRISGGLVTVEGTGTRSAIGNIPVTTFDFTRIDGTQDPNNVGEFFISGATGDLAMFNPPPLEYGLIKDLTNFNIGNPANPFGLPVDNFLDFSSLTIPIASGNLGNYFDLLTLGVPEYSQTSTGITVSVGVTGTFQIQGFLDTPGVGTYGAEITFAELSQTTGTPINSLQAFLDYIAVEGNTIEGLSWSANNFLLEAAPPVPEPSSLVGLFALTGTGLLMSRKRQQKQK